MVKIRFLTLIFFLLSVPALAFQTKIANPTRIAVCQDKLWVYDRSARELVTLDLKEGSVLSRAPLPIKKKFLHLSALACYKNQLIFSVEISKHPSQSSIHFLSLDLPQSIEWNSRIDSITCNDQACFVLSKGLLYRWKNPTEKSSQLETVRMPELKSIRSTQWDTEANPFADWAEHMGQADGRLSRALLLPTGTLLLVDTFRAHIVKKEGQQLTHWGEWGVWEGQLYRPKTLVFFKLGLLAVLDAGLKIITFFDLEGHYKGTLLNSSKKIPPFQWPIDIAANESRIFVADQKAGTIEAYDVRPSEILRAPAKNQDSLLRTNLFRRADRVQDTTNDRCLNCHDGTINDSLDYFQGKSQILTHPVQVELKRKSTLPVDPDGNVSCMSCHDPHHGITPLRKAKKSKKLAPDHPFLRANPPELCLKCHDDKQNTPTNHPLIKEATCTRCHTVHGNSANPILKKSAQLCLECHQPMKLGHRLVSVVLETERAHDLKFEDGYISCATCHKTHDATAQKMLRGDPSVKEFCASCHGAKTPNLFEHFHPLMKKRGVKWD